MSTSRFFNGIALGVMAVAIALTVLLNLFAAENADTVGTVMGYEEKIFDTSMVHTIDIQMDDWEGFLDTAVREEYSSCTVVIDGEVYANVGIRGKGNTSLTSVQSIGNDRYSFKLEFDQYQDGQTYYGLDKLCLNNLYADHTYMKDYLIYSMMQDMGVAAPLCSYVYLTVNGEDWGLYLAAEGVEEGFLQRNYGKDYGELYKPDTAEMGGGMESADVKLQYIDDDPDSYSNIFDNAKTGITNSDRQRLIQALENLSNQERLEETVDTEAVIRYLVVHNFVCNDDSYTGTMVHNYYLYEDDGMLSMIPWDYNLAFGGFSRMGEGGSKPERGALAEGASQAVSQVNFPVDSPVSGDISDRPMVAWIFDEAGYQDLYHSCYTLFLKEFFADGALEKEITRVQQLIAPYVEKDPTAFCSYEEFKAGVEAMREFLNLRSESVLGQLAGTIPSTREGQQADASSLVSADGLDLNLMGQMNMEGIPSEGRPEGNMQPPEIPEGNMQPPEIPEGNMQPLEIPEGNMQPPEMPEGNMQPPEMPEGNMQPPRQ